MTPDEILDYCMRKPGVYLDWPFGPIPICARLQAGDRRPILVQLYPLADDYKVTIRCDPREALFYRDKYPDAVKRGYYCPPNQQPYWNTVSLRGPVPDEELRHMLDHAYNQVILRLPKYLQDLFREASESERG